MKLLLTTCGCGGGNAGPSGLYNHFQEFLGPDWTVYNSDTIPESVDINVGYLLRMIDEFVNNGIKEIYLCGWSMGGATVIKTAYFANFKYQNLKPIKGLVLLATQGAKTKLINNIDIPILFLHGTNDKVLSHEISVKLCEDYSYYNHIEILEGFDHNFRSCLEYCELDQIAKNITSLITRLFQ